MYDAQLKKMLAYIAVAISSFVAQLALFYFVTTAASRFPDNLTLILTTALLASQWYFVIATFTKFQELIILENELGIRKMYDVMRQYRYSFARAWDWGHRGFLRVHGSEYKRMNVSFTIVTILFLVFTFFVWRQIVRSLFPGWL